MSKFDWVLVLNIFQGCLGLTALVVVLFSVAVALDIAVHWLRARGVSGALCAVMSTLALILAALDALLIFSWALWHFLHLLPLIKF